MNRVRSQGLALVTLLVACAAARSQPERLEQSQVRHPEASTFYIADDRDADPFAAALAYARSPGEQ